MMVYIGLLVIVKETGIRIIGFKIRFYDFVRIDYSVSKEYDITEPVENADYIGIRDNTKELLGILQCYYKGRNQNE